MRCPTCRSTGYTEAELFAHEAKSGHKLPADRALWATSKDFEDKPRPRFTREELIEALREARISPDELEGIEGGAPP